MRETRTRATHWAALAAIVAAATGMTGTGCGSGGPGGGDAGVPTLALALVSPAGDTYTNRLVTIEVGITPTPPGGFEVRLFRNGLALAGLTGPYTFPWDTTYETEGTYDIEARATVGGREVSSGSVKVVIDRTPPAIVSQTPSASDRNLSLRDPLRIVFSETLAAATVSTDSVRLETGSGRISSTAALDPDGKTVIVTILNPSEVMVPGELRLTVALSVTDLAGNAHVAVPPTSWKVPSWVDLGSPSSGVSQMVIAGGHLIAAGGSPLVGAARYAGGTSWESMGSPQTTTSDQTVLAADHYGTPYLAWLDVADVDGRPIAVARWSGTRWEALGRLQSAAGAMAVPPIHLSLDNQDRPAVSWGNGNVDTYVARWDGTTWQLPYGSVPVRGYGLALGGQGQPALAFASGGRFDLPGILRWTGLDWTTVTTSLSFIGDYFQLLRFDAIERLLVVTVSGRVLRDDTFDEIVPAMPAAPALPNSPSFALDSRDYPIAAWRDDNDVLHVRRWTSAAWINLETPKRPDDPTGLGSWPLVAVDANDAVVVAWTELGSDATGKEWTRSFVRRTNR